MSTKKTSGFVNIEDYNFVQCSPEEVKDWAGRGTFKAATLVIGEGDTPPKVFTEEEVKSKDEDMKWALNWINNEAKHLRERGEPQEALEVALEMMLERHGIVLDPA